MAITNICGFEMGAQAASTTDYETVLLTASVPATFDTTIKRSGNYSLRVAPVTTETCSTRLPVSHTATGVSGTAGLATSYFRFYLYIATLPSATERLFTVLNAAAATKASSALRADGTLSLSSSATLLGGSTTALTTGTWYRIEIKLETGTSVAAELLINGTSEVSSSTANLTTSNALYAVFGKHTNANGSGYVVYFDDAAISDSGYPGAGAVACLRPTGNGNYTAWTGTYADVDDLTSQAGHDTDTTFINSSTNTQAETVALENCSDRGISGTVNAVKTCVIARDVSNTTNIQHRTRVTSPGTADTDLSLYDNAGAYVLLANVLSVNPSGSAAWTTAGVDSLEVGIVHSQANAREARATLICAMVDFTAVEGIATTGAAAQAAAGTETPSSDVATSGAAVNASAGTVTVYSADVTRPATGAAVNAAAGTPGVTRDITATGNAVNAAAGTPGVTRAPATLVGAAVNAAAGTPGVDRAPATLTGATVNVAAGTPVAFWTQAGLGVNATTTAGTISIQTAITLSGATVNAAAGYVGAGGDVIRAATGAAVNVASGTLGVQSVLQALTGATGNASSGTLVAQGSLTLAGAVENSAAGSLGIGRTTSLAGATATATSGTVVAQASGSALLTGATVNVAAGTVGAAGAFTALLTGATANATAGNVAAEGAFTALLSGATVNVSAGTLAALNTHSAALDWTTANARAGNVIFQLVTVYEGSERHGGVRPVVDTWRKRRMRDLRSIGTK